MKSQSHADANRGRIGSETSRGIGRETSRGIGREVNGKRLGGILRKSAVLAFVCLSIAMFMAMGAGMASASTGATSMGVTMGGAGSTSSSSKGGNLLGTLFNSMAGQGSAATSSSSVQSGAANGGATNGATTTGNATTGGAANTTTTGGNTGGTGSKQAATISIRQVDNSAFPDITFYASVTDTTGGVIEGLTTDDFTVQETVSGQTASDVILKDVSQVQQSAQVSVDLVLDKSGSMADDDKMTQAVAAANAFVGKADLASGDTVEITSFDDYVYVSTDFSNDATVLSTALAGLSPNGGTALYDALYSAVYQTYQNATGAKCVIAFTDGLENASTSTFDDVVDVSSSTGIPVYIVGIGAGTDYDATTLEQLADACNGEFFSATSSDLESVLTQVYTELYEQAQGYYCFTYTAKDTSEDDTDRTIAVSAASAAPITGNATADYVTKTVIDLDFASDYSNVDYIIPDSSSREISTSELAGMSLAQLRIARNEIFARHGRQFHDFMLNEWFYSKTWYLNISNKYAPDDFDANNPNPLSDLEVDNVDTILAYEQSIMASQDIYPNASTVLLSGYDLCLSKDVLNVALTQMQGYTPTTVLSTNMAAVQEKINTPDVNY